MILIDKYFYRNGVFDCSWCMYFFDKLVQGTWASCVSYVSDLVQEGWSSKENLQVNLGLEARDCISEIKTNAFSKHCEV